MSGGGMELTWTQIFAIAGLVILDIPVLWLLHWLIFQDENNPRSLTDDLTSLVGFRDDWWMMLIPRWARWLIDGEGELERMQRGVSIPLIVFLIAFGGVVGGEWYLLARTWPETFSNQPPNRDYLLDPPPKAPAPIE